MVASCCLLPACNDNNNTGEQPVQLEAPVVSLVDNVISWNAVPHADKYEVYQGESKAAEVEGTSYTITVTQAGEYTYTVYAVSNDAAYSKSQSSHAVTYTVVPQQAETTPLYAPVISIVGNVISWNAVPHADKYEVYQGDSKVAEVTVTSYTVNITASGVYNFTVYALSDDAAYSPSEASNAVTYTVAQQPQGPTALDTPVLSLTGNILSWDKVQNASQYEVYRNGVLVDTVETLFYKIKENAGGTYNYQVKAIPKTGQNDYVASSLSEAKAYELAAFDFTVSIIATGGFDSNKYSAFTVALFKKGNVKVEGSEQHVDLTNGAGEVTYTNMVDDIYIAKIVSTLGDIGYYAETATISSQEPNATITIKKMPTDGNILNVGKNSISATAADIGAVSDERFQYLFIVPADGYYTFESEANMDVSLDGELILQPSQGWTNTVLYLYRGVYNVAVTPDAAGTLELQVVRGIVEKDLSIGKAYGENPNFVADGDLGEWNLSISESRFYEFSFGPSLSDKEVTITITDSAGKDQTYVFNALAEGSAARIGLNAGEYTVKISVSVNSGRKDFDYVAFFIFPSK